MTGKSIQELVEWGAENQTILNPRVQIYQDEVTGLSFKAGNKDVIAGEKIVTCSYETSLSYLNLIQASIKGESETSKFSSHESASFPQNFINELSIDDPNVLGYFFLVQQYLMKEKSFWYPYIRLLPQPDDPKSLGIPLWWPEEDQELLAGTNAEPAMKKRRELWQGEWMRAKRLLEDDSMQPQDRERFTAYTYELYQWAATIFGSRSFRASLTIAEDMISGIEGDHASNDRFSILLPIMDIGNHNGVNNADWKSDKQHGLTFSIRNAVEAGNQIFNYYGDKSNSELLLAYGFMLPDDYNDVVNLKVGVEVVDATKGWLRSRKCHVVPKNLEEEFLFPIRKHKAVSTVSVSSPFTILPHGLVELMVYFLANDRERRYLESTNYCIGSDPNVFTGPLYKASLLTLNAIFHKLQQEHARLTSTDRLKVPQNLRQHTIKDYRNRQVAVVSSILSSISADLSSVMGNYRSFQEHKQTTQVLTLESAFEWLGEHYPEISKSVIKIIAEDQEMETPLNWVEIIDEDWDCAYWIVWIFILEALSSQDLDFSTKHKGLYIWLEEVKKAYELDILHNGSIYYTEPSEQETIDITIQAIMDLPIWRNSLSESYLRIRNFASFVIKEETFSIRTQMKGNGGSAVQQKVLAINLDIMDDQGRRDGSRDWIGQVA